LGLYILVVLWVIVSIYINITGGVDTTAYHGYLKSSPERTNTESNINNNSNNNENADSNSNNVSVGGNRNNDYGGLSSTVTTINKPHIHYFASDSNTSVIPLGALGTLSIDRHGMGMNGAGYTIKMDEPMGPLDFYAVVSVNNSNFYIVRSIGGTACPGLFSVVYLNNHWRFVSTKEFGTCATRTKITATTKKIFFSMYTNGDEKKIYTFNLPKQIRHSATRYVPAQPAESKDHELKSKLIKVTNMLTNDYNKVLGEYNPASDRKIKNAEINWIIQKRAACGTYASDLEPNNESGLECQIAATQQRIKQLNKLLTSN
jgi:uncharacterized protein YecT (DUF1311 family)